jgi:hypothetical protein
MTFSTKKNSVPVENLVWLERWFVIHFMIDVAVGLPLLIAPQLVLNLIGFETAKSWMARIIAAALMGIGVESWLGRKASKEGYFGMLRLKIIWSGAVVMGLVMSLLSGEIDLLRGGIMMGIFMAFNLVWVYWLLKLRKGKS